ncbi:hypothetical protein [Silvanigrella aquatica]|uniref:Uncharacterized protein n=1 Tax=Silvanigrella aquatica TaxID=1915309 RepID=A0A1L4D0R5_9BACT|nr:hypothetical protein [Silvanigrella aquatica]APJ03812.1 hypothetical protein AXG55_07800 [Silvanigrella aquatica]
MFDLPPQVYNVDNNQIETITIPEYYQIPLASPKPTVLQINNQTGYKVYITSSVNNPADWYNGANPGVNFNGVTIDSSNYLKRNENVNSTTAAAFFNMTLTFTARSGDEAIGMTINQLDVFKPNATNIFYPTFRVGIQDFTGSYRVDQTILGNANIFTLTHNQ